MKMKDIKVAVINHGCKLNQFEGEAIENSFRLADFTVINFHKNYRPDITIVNTCTVTQKSDRKSRNTILKAGKVKKGGGLLIVTGCYAETNPDDLKRISGVDFVIGNRAKPVIVDIVKAYLQKGWFETDVIESPFNFKDPDYPDRSRVYVKVQDGCNTNCSYCKVPLARGGSKSRDYDDVISYVKRVAKNGYKEVVLTGINLGDYCYNGKTLFDLIALLLEGSEDYRIRLSSIEANFFNDNLFAIIKNERVTPHFHIPLQSGSDRILKMMKRPYQADTYMRVVNRVRDIRPESHIATDVMVGFPTEKEEDFQGTLNVIENASFASVHIFKYSVRNGTDAASMKNDVHYSEKVSRSRKVMELSEHLNYEYRKKFLGKQLKGIFERHNGFWEGITDNYIRVILGEGLTRPYANKNLNKKILPIRITRVEKKETFGEVIF